MHSLKEFVIFSLCLLCWHSSCDKIGDGEIPVKKPDHVVALPGKRTHEPAVDSRNIDLSLKNVNIKSEEIATNIHSEDAKEMLNNIGKKKVLNHPDVKISKFSEQLRKMRRRDTPLDTLNIKRKLKIPNDSDAEIAEGNDSETEERDSSLSSEKVIPTKIADENIPNLELESSQLKSGDKEPPATPIVTDKIIGSQAASPKVETADGTATKVLPSESTPNGQETPDPGPHSEAMPSFDEWKKMMLAEQENGGHNVPSVGPPGKKLASQKRRRNYASYECGAKVVASNAEGEGTRQILNERMDEYMLNPCKAKIWFVIELCETVQASQIELANFELFSSCPRDFAVASSDNFPTRDWVPEGIFTAAEQRVLQSFQLKSEGFSKFIKVEFLSHYGKEHYCPLNVVRVFGTSMVDEYEEMEKMSDHHIVPDDEYDRIDMPVEDTGSSNIFGSATDAVYNIVKKAAHVFGQHQTIEESTNKGIEQNMSEADHCKLMDDSCIKDNKNISESNISDSETLSGSLHHSLYHYLRHCDQCISVSRPSYYSVALPQCRFFQAAFGPVVYKSICDWFKDHLLITLQKETIIDIVRNHSAASRDTPAPPPTIISVIIEKEAIPQALPSYDDTSSTPSASSSIAAEETSHLPPSPKTIEHVITTAEQVIKPAIQPTKTTQSAEDSPYMDLGRPLRTELPLENSGLSEVPAEVKQIEEKVLLPSTEKLPVKTSDSVAPTVIIPSPSEVVPTSSNATKKPDNDDKLDLGYDENLVLEIETATVEVPTVESGLREFTVDTKTGEIKFDAREPTTRLDPVVVGSATFSASQKESVFVRMNNRIKALELNMSLSSQYLQELSQRYRRQMEEMQRAFNRTIGTLNDTAKKAAERDLKQQEVIGSLQSQLSNLTLTVEQMFERHIFLMMTEAIVMITIMSLCVRRISSSIPHQTPLPVPENVSRPSRSDMKRRNSTSSSSPPSTKRIKKRSASDEALLLDEPIIIEPIQPVIVEPLLKIKKKHKKKKQMKRSASNPAMSPRKDSSKQPSKEDTCAAGIIFSSSSVKSDSIEHFYENCDSKKNCNSRRNHSAGKRTNSIPLKNLTNGTGVGIEPYNFHFTPPPLPGKDKFSFRKFLRFQKRESI